MRFLRWLDAWITTLMVAPPFSKRRAELLEIMNDPIDTDHYVEVDPVTRKTRDIAPPLEEFDPEELAVDPDAFGELGKTYLTPRAGGEDFETYGFPIEGIIDRRRDES